MAKTQAEKRKDKRKANAAGAGAGAAGPKLNDKERAYYDMLKKTQPGGAAEAYKSQVFADQAAPAGAAGAAAPADFSTPAGVIAAQDSANADAQIASNFDTVGPTGTTSVTYDPVTGAPTQTTTLSAPEQAILDGDQKQQLDIQGGANTALTQAQEAMAQPLNYDGLQQVDVQNDATRQRVEDAVMRRSERLTGDHFNQQRTQEEANLRQRGFQFGGQDYNSQFNDRVTNPQNQARLDMADRAILTGGQEADRMFSNQTANRNQGIQERTDLRHNSLSEAQSFLGMQRGALVPQAGATAGRATTDVAGVAGMFGNWANADKQKALDRDFQNKQAAQDRKFQARQGAANRATSTTNANAGVGTALTVAEFNAGARQDDMLLADRLNRGNQPRPPSVVGGVISGIASGIGAGIGDAVGSYMGAK